MRPRLSNEALLGRIPNAGVWLDQVGCNMMKERSLIMSLL
jgi:hypothetical protein